MSDEIFNLTSIQMMNKVYKTMNKNKNKNKKIERETTKFYIRKTVC